jgi:prepilin-type N-terminal cleavage/methylation domain-containing protein
MNHCGSYKGFTLVELLVALALATLLISGATQLVLAASKSYQLQRNVSELQENARLALESMTSAVEGTGYHPQPWLAASGLEGIGSLSQDNINSRGDRLNLAGWSDRNCFENPNPVRDETGQPRFFLREMAFSINGSKNLAVNCRYGPSAGQMTTQVNNLGLVENAEMLQLLFAEDTNDDQNADRWVSAGQWQNQQQVLAVRFGLLLASLDPLDTPRAELHQVLDELHRSPADGRLRKVFTTTAVIRGRLR